MATKTQKTREHYEIPVLIKVEHELFSDPDVKCGDWLLWKPDKQELQHGRWMKH